MLRATAAFAKRSRVQINSRKDSGQSLIETALAIPFLLLIALNAINFAYYFFVAINLSAAPRNAVEYSVQGFATPGQLSIPQPGPACASTDRTAGTDPAVSSLTYYDIIAVLPNQPGGGPACPGIGSVQVCNSYKDASGGGTFVSGGNVFTTCHSYGAAASFGRALDPDPESPNFVLDRVDVVYKVTPLIGGNVFGIYLLPNFTFHRQVSMREMN